MMDGLSLFQQYFSHLRTLEGKDECEGLCALKRRLGSERISPLARFDS